MDGGDGYLLDTSFSALHSMFQNTEHLSFRSLIKLLKEYSLVFGPMSKMAWVIISFWNTGNVPILLGFRISMPQTHFNHATFLQAQALIA